MSEKFALLVPVKALSRAKSRLVGADAETRVGLMRAFAMDAIVAAAQSVHVHAVHVVTDEAGFDVRGAGVLPDEGGGDLNAALRNAAVRVRLANPGTSVAVMCADLPALRTADLDAALTAGMSPRWFVADAAGTGTTLLAAGPGVDLEPHFGADSARRHEESGAVSVKADVPTLRIDVDTDADLVRARQVGVGPYTRQEMQKRR